MKKGYGVFGKAYGKMFLNDLHDSNSIDHIFLKNMILIDEESKDFLYDKPNLITDNVKNHNLYEFSKQFRDKDDLVKIKNLIGFINGIVKNFDTDFEDMIFGGTEKEIIERGTDWCADISRVGAALLQCLGIPSRIVIIVNENVAYNGHQVVEAYIKGKYMICDFLYGVIGNLDHIYSVYDLLNNKRLIEETYQEVIKSDSQLAYISGLFSLAAISEYDITQEFDYSVSRPNEYYLNMMRLKHNGKWQMGEDE